MNETIGYIIIGIGVAFDLCGTVGLVRLPDVYNRLQAATKCVTLGTCLILIGAAVVNGTGVMISRAVICAVFVLLTSPVGAHALARGSHLAGVRLWQESVMDKYEEDARRVRDFIDTGEDPAEADQPEA